MRPVDIGSRDEQGSSIRITSGDTAMARAMQSRCCWPPDMASAFCLSLSLTSSHRAAPRRDRSTSSSMLSGCMPMTLGPKAMFS